MLKDIIVFLHVISVLGYLLSHGVSVSVAFALKREADPQRMRALLDLSGASNPSMLWSLLATIVFGIIAGFQGGWWRAGWIWASIILLVVIIVLMALLGAGVFGEIRRAVGLPYRIKGKPFPAVPALSSPEIEVVKAKINPILLTIIGYGGYAVIAWLMTDKPF
jgi:hypothetical protein